MRASIGFRILALGAALAALGCGPKLAPRMAEGSTAPRAPSARHGGAPGAAAEADCDEASTPAAASEDHGDGTSTLDDGFEAPPLSEASLAAAAPAPFADINDAELAASLKTDIGARGPMSIGRPHSGVLVAGVHMPEGAAWELVSPSLAWGTQETVDALAHAFDAVAARFPGTPKAFLGDISAKRGGHLPPHVSHQSGRDVDLGYYYLADGHRWYANANATNLDRARTWHLIRTLIAESDVDLILVDLQLQRLLKAYALEIGEDPTWLDEVFQVGGKSKRPILFHVKGHATHLHVRFYSPAAQELGRRAYRLLLARHLVSPPTLYITHTVKAGETLSHLARRYKVTVEAIKKANALSTDTLRLAKPYKIPQTGGIAMPARVVVPSRRVPPSPAGDPKKHTREPCRRPTP